MMSASRSREGAWIEINPTWKSKGPTQSRSREGAWIEIRIYCYSVYSRSVAPVRERGLKSKRNFMQVLTEEVAPVRERGLKF